MKTMLRIAYELLLWAWGRRFRYRVAGRSMEPTLYPNEYLLAVKRSTRNPPDIAAGDLVLCYHPIESETLIVKRFKGWTPQGRVLLASDNPDHGTDSRHWGPVECDLLFGRVTLVLNRPRGSYR